MRTIDSFISEHRHELHGYTYYIVWSDIGDFVLETDSREEAEKYAAFFLRMWETNEASTSVYTVSGGAWESNRSRH